MRLLILLLVVGLAPAATFAEDSVDLVQKHIEQVRHQTGNARGLGFVQRDEDGDLVTVFVRAPRSIGDRSGMFHDPSNWLAEAGPGPLVPTGACDTLAECKAKVKRLCEDYDHGTLKPGTEEIVVHAEGGGKTCSGDCTQDGAVAFVTCDAKPNKP
jgi:hypothetical protein